jgi:16S rRNA (cytosine967-C5)-methyltransferase
MQYSSLIGHAVELFSEIKDWKNPADKTISKFYEERRYLGSNDRSFITESVYDLIRKYKMTDTLTKISLEKFPQYKEEMPVELLFYTLFISAPAEYPLEDKGFFDFFPEKITDINFDELRSVIEENIAKLEESAPDIKYSYPEWMLEKFKKVTTEENLPPLLDSLNKPAPTIIRVVTSKTARGKLIEVFHKKKKVEAEKTHLAPEGIMIPKRMNFQEMDEFKRGCFEVQDEGSQIVTLLTDPKPGMIILDVCAGGGGKTIYISDLMKNSGKIFAFDIDKERIKNLTKRLKNKNYKNINIIKTKDELKYYISTFDVVLVDAPCTGSGTIRRNPDLKWRIKESDIAKYTKIQSEILNEYSKFVKVNGALVYITCSLFREENEEIIETFLADKPGFDYVNAFQLLKSYDVYKEPDPRFNDESGQGKYLRLLPNTHNTDGFFGCILRREH